MDEILKIENRKKDKANEETRKKMEEEKAKLEEDLKKKYEEEQRINNEELQRQLKHAEELRLQIQLQESQPKDDHVKESMKLEIENLQK